MQYCVSYLMYGCQHDHDGGALNAYPPHDCLLQWLLILAAVMDYEVASPGPPALDKQQPLEARMRAMELLPQGEPEKKVPHDRTPVRVPIRSSHKHNYYTANRPFTFITLGCNSYFQYYKNDENTKWSQHWKHLIQAVETEIYNTQPMLTEQWQYVLDCTAIPYSTHL